MHAHHACPMRRLVRSAAAVALLALAAPAMAQPQTILFPGQSGATLRASLRAAYRPTTVVSYSTAQDRLMDTVDRTTVGGQAGVVCVYTGWFVPFDGQPSTDPNQDIYNNGAGLNVEHTWPQSLLTGDAAPAVGSVHQLYPSEVGTNGARSNYRFAEIPDNITSRWYRGAPPYNQTTIPTANINEYSELRASTSFEPREDHKGNVARSLFYVNTMWTAQTSSAFPFDATDQRTLYLWSYADPVNQAEYDRTYRAANFNLSSSNQPLPNPFVLDSTLIRRAYFPNIQVVPTGTETAPAAPTATLAVAPSPFTDAASLLFVPSANARVTVEAYDVMGRRVAQLFDGAATAGTPLPLRLDGTTLAPGVYVVRAVQADGTVVTRSVVRG